MTSTKTPDIHLYTDQTPNGVKITIGLEELGVPYEIHTVDISKNIQKEPWFLEINPNGRIPALKDGDLRLFESGSILQYLVDEYDVNHKISYPRGTKEYYEMNNWLWFQNAGVGPMQGQANHFFRYAPEKIEYGINRYVNETRRLYKVLDDHLKQTGSQYLVGDKCTIADITHFGWIFWSGWAGVDINEFPTLKAWEERMLDRPAVAKGNDLPHPSKVKHMLKDPKALDEFANKTRGWVLQGMKDDEKKK